MDYSKWDRMARDIEDDEEYDEEEAPQPLVTRFDDARGKSITIGPCGASIASTAPTAEQAPKAAPVPAAGADSSSTKNGGRTTDYSWSQSRDEVVMQMPLAQQRARDLRVSFDSKTRLLRITHAQPGGEAELLSRTLQHDIHPAETDDGTLATVDWEVRSRRPREAADGAEEERILELTLRKKPPFPGVTVWWKAVCEGDPEIDVSKIAGRDAAKVQDTNSLWREAHELFLEKVRTNERVVVDLEGEEEAEAGGWEA